MEKGLFGLRLLCSFPLKQKKKTENKISLSSPHSTLRGCLFYGPPGTGKTLLARALANECSQGDRKVSFFMRKGADCLSKWVGESERQLRLLFDQVRPCDHIRLLAFAALAHKFAEHGSFY